MYRVSHKGGRVVDRDRSAPNHTNLGVLKWAAQVFQGRGFGDDIGSNEYDYRTDRLLEEQVNGRGFAFTLLLDAQSQSRLLPGNFSYHRYRAICTTTGNDDNFLNVQRWPALLEYSANGMSNVRLFVVRSEERRVGKECRSRW